MGNLGSCCSAGAGEARCCSGDEGTKSKKMVPADLHSSGAQSDKRTAEQHKGRSQPTTLSSSGSSSRSTTKQTGSSSKYSGFSLHGVQKTSPSGNSNESLSTQQKVVRHKFLAKNINAFFETYKDKQSDDILEDGIERFCSDLNVDPAEFIVLALAWKFKAAKMCKFTREEFTQGCTSMQVDSIESLSDAFAALEKDALTNFRDVYKFAFQFGLDADQGQRSLPCEVAIGMWQVVFSKKIPSLLQEWISFLEVNQVRGISRDTWNMFLHFTDNIGTDLSNYDDSEAWPSLFDDFVEYYREQRKTRDQSQECIIEKTDQESGERKDEPTQEIASSWNPTEPGSTNSEENSEPDNLVSTCVTEENDVGTESEPLTSNNLHSSVI